MGSCSSRTVRGSGEGRGWEREGQTLFIIVLLSQGEVLPLRGQLKTSGDIFGRHIGGRVATGGKGVQGHEIPLNAQDSPTGRE